MSGQGYLYVVDTTVLFAWVASRTAEARREDSDRRYNDACRELCESRGRSFFIPGVVWTELHGVFLQKDIAVESYETWYRQRKAALQQIYPFVYGPDATFRLGEGEFDMDLAINLCCQKASSSAIRDLRLRIEDSARRDRCTRSRLQAARKLLDGMDSAILATAWEVAEKEPHRVVYLVTGDQALLVALRSLVGQEVCRHRFPSNLRPLCPTGKSWGTGSPMRWE